MKVAFVIGLIIIGLVVFAGVYPAIKAAIDSADTTGFDTLLAAYVGNLWWIAILLGLVAVVSAWWLYQKR